MGVTKKIKNHSVQGLELYLTTDKGPETIWLQPKQIVVVEESQITQQIRNLHNRRMIQISN